MSEEEIKKIAKEEFMNNVMEQLDSTLIFTYIQKLEKENKELKQEIERLNNIINKAIEYLRKNACIDEDLEYFCDDLRYDECKKLLEILKGDDKE